MHDPTGRATEDKAPEAPRCFGGLNSLYGWRAPQQDSYVTVGSRFSLGRVPQMPAWSLVRKGVANVYYEVVNAKKKSWDGNLAADGTGY